MISLRTKAALAEANRRGARLGNPEQAKANRFSKKMPTHADHHTTGERPPSTLIAVPVI
jgi:hypothetical protein